MARPSTCGWVKAMMPSCGAPITVKPRGLHLMLSPVHLSVADQYLADLDWATETARGGGGTGGAAVGYGR